MNSCMNFVDALYKMHYEKAYEMMIWIDCELSDLNYASSMKKYFSDSENYEKVWIHVWKSMFQQACYMKMYELSEYCIVWGVHLSRT